MLMDLVQAGDIANMIANPVLVHVAIDVGVRAVWNDRTGHEHTSQES